MAKEQWVYSRPFDNAFGNGGRALPLKIRCGETEIANMATVSGQWDNTKLIVAAVNACIAINPSNPMAVAEGMEDLISAYKRLQEWQELSTELLSAPKPDSIFLKNARKLTDAAENALAAINKPAKKGD